MIKNVVFDIGNVLMDFDWMGYMHSLYGEDNALIKSINEAIWKHDCWQAMDRGEMDGKAATEESIRHAPELEREIRQTLENAGNSMHRFNYAIPWIKELRAMGKGTLYLSNYSTFAMDANRGVLDFLPYMDGGVFSCHVRLAKPDHRIYHCLCEKFSLNPEECLFTDDMPANIKAAEECGFHAVLFEGYEKSYPTIMYMLRQ